MSTNLRITLLIFSIVWYVLIFICIRKNKLPIKYSLVWLCAITIILLISVFPSILDVIASTFGFLTISNLVIGTLLTLLLFITLILTMIIYYQKKQIILLIQEVSMLKVKKENKK